MTRTVPSPSEANRGSAPLREPRPLETAGSRRRMRGSAPAPAVTEMIPSSVRNSWNELKEQAVLAFESGLLPRSVDTPQKAITIALLGREFDLTPMQALCGIYVVNGMAALRGSLMLRLIYERVPGAQISFLTPPERADQECEVEMQRPGGKPQRFRFTLDDARKAGFLNKPIWQQHTSTMLRWAAVRTGARVVFSDAIAGCYMEDELPAEPASAPAPETVAAEPSAETPTPTAETPRSATPALDLRPVTDKQVNRLFAIAHAKQWSRADIGVWLMKWYGKRDPKTLTRSEYDRICNFLLAGPSKGMSEAGFEIGDGDSASENDATLTEPSDR